jgi:hypothetical protein
MARAACPAVARPRAWQVLDVLVGLTMLVLAWTRPWPSRPPDRNVARSAPAPGIIRPAIGGCPRWPPAHVGLVFVGP